MRPLAPSPARRLGVQWSPDGSRLATRSRPTSNGPRDSAIALLSQPHACGNDHRRRRPDGDGVVTGRPATRGVRAGGGGVGLQVFDRQGRLERDIALPPQARPSKGEIPVPSVKWSPDGQFLAVSQWCPCSSANGHTWIVARDGSDTREIRGPGGGNAVAVDWSPDGTRLAIASLDQDSGELWVADADGTSAHRIATVFNPIVEVSGWSPDGRWIAFEKATCLMSSARMAPAIRSGSASAPRPPDGPSVNACST